MKRWTLVIGIAVFLIPTAAVAQDVADLLSEPVSRAGREVVLTGELVGDFSSRTDGVWVQLNDDPYVESPLVEDGVDGSNTGIGVRIPKSLFDHTWGPPGGYDVRGPIVEVTGTFRYQDPDRSGETYVDVSAVRLISMSRDIATGSAGWPLALGGAMTAIATLLLVRRRRTTPTGRVLPSH